MLHYDENTQLIFALRHLWDDDIEYLRGAEEVGLPLQVLQSPHNLYLSDDLDTIVVPSGEILDVLDGHLLTGAFAHTFHDSSVASLAQYALEGVRLRDLMPCPRQLGCARAIGSVRTHLLVLHVGRSERFLVCKVLPLINVDRNMCFFCVLKFPKLAL